MADRLQTACLYIFVVKIILCLEYIQDKYVLLEFLASQNLVNLYTYLPRAENVGHAR